MQNKNESLGYGYLPLKKVIEGDGDYLKNGEIEFNVECKYGNEKRMMYNNGSKLEFDHLFDNIDSKNTNITNEIYSE